MYNIAQHTSTHTVYSCIVYTQENNYSQEAPKSYIHCCFRLVNDYANLVSACLINTPTMCPRFIDYDDNFVCIVIGYFREYEKFRETVCASSSGAQDEIFKNKNAMGISWTVSLIQS